MPVGCTHVVNRVWHVHATKATFERSSHTVNWENLAKINFHWLAKPQVFAHLIFTIRWQFSSISLLKLTF